MSETQSMYCVSGLLTGPKKSSLLPISNPNYSSPDREDIKSIVSKFNLTGAAVAGITGVGTRQVRKWMSPEDTSNHTPIPYAAWRLLLIELGVVPPFQK